MAQSEPRDLLFRSARLLRAFAKRWAPGAMKRLAWNAEFRRGRHIRSAEVQERPRFCDVIERHANGGDILDLGCGDGRIGMGLFSNTYASYTGVDISDVGIEHARKVFSSGDRERLNKSRFFSADMTKYRPDRAMDVIVFKVSLYYINRVEMLGVLKRYERSLKPNGVFVVIMDDIVRHEWICNLIRNHFTLVEEEAIPDIKGIFMVFR